MPRKSNRRRAPRELIRRGGRAPKFPLLDIGQALVGRVDDACVVDGVSARWFAPDVPAVGARGYLFEPERKNYLLRSRWLEASWSGAGTPAGSIVAGSSAPGTAPDGTTPARVTLGTSTTSMIQQTMGAATLPDGTLLTPSVFVRLVSGSGLLRLRIQRKDATASPDYDFVATTSWQRFVMPTTDVLAGASGGIMRLLNRDAASTQVFEVWAFLASGGVARPTRWAHSPSVHTSTTALVAYPGTMSWIPPQVPLALRAKRTRWKFTPLWAPTDLVSGDVGWLGMFGFGALDGLRWRHTGTDVRIEVVIAGVVVAQSQALTGSVREVLRTIVLDPVAGVVYVNGVAGPAGTPWAFPAAVDFALGGSFNNGNEPSGMLKLPEAI